MIIRILRSRGGTVLLVAALSFGVLEAVAGIVLRSNILGLGYATNPILRNVYDDETSYRARLARYASEPPENVQQYFDEELGWIRAAEPPLETIDPTKKVALFFGDSFVYGLTSREHTIPHLLDVMLKDIVVVNLGVPGYGLDQIYLRAKRVLRNFKPTHILIGISYNDLDRCVYKVREAPKPYFEIVDNQLLLKGTPVSADYKQWPALYPIEARSHLWSITKGMFIRFATSGWAMKHVPWIHPSKLLSGGKDRRDLARKLLAELRNLASSLNVPLTVIIFPDDEYGLLYDSWYDVFLEESLIALNIDKLNTRDPLRHRLITQGLNWTRDIYTISKHPNEEENRLIAGYIAGHLKRSYGYR